MRSLAFLALVPFVLGQSYVFNLNCANYAGPCNNDCYAVYIANSPMTLTYNGPNKKAAQSRRSASGCVSPTPCGNGKMSTPSAGENTCDEYPYASVLEGGSGALLRCTDGTQNSKEGSDLTAMYKSVCKSKTCTFTLSYGNPAQAPYCNTGMGKNDGFEYTYNGKGTGKYTLAGRDTNGTEDNGWGIHEPDETDFFPPHLRREFLLADGSRTLLLSRNLTASYEDAIFVSVHNGTVFENPMVRELFGLEKSPAFQDPALHASKREIGFAA